MPDSELAGASLTIDLDAIAANWRLLRRRVDPSECAAVVKADAYGLGAAHVVPALVGAGCSTFFVATPEEGVAVREILHPLATKGVPEPIVYVFHGAPRGSELVFAEQRLRPVLGSRGDIDAWSAFAARREPPPPAAIHIDTGMSRLGLPRDELDALADDPRPLSRFPATLLMSHLACADTPDHAANAMQLEAFRTAVRRLPAAPTSFANSSGIFLGRAFHGDVARPGAALYGVAPAPGTPNPMRQVVRLLGKILQVREIDRGQSVGYGATFVAARRTTIATVAVGYADGFLRSLSNSGKGVIDGRPVPIVGRVSMDLITLDATGLPSHLVRPGETVELIGPERPVDAVAADAGTIGYEILTSLGARYHRVYVHGD